VNMDQYKFNSHIHGKCTRRSSKLHQTASKLCLAEVPTIRTLRFPIVFCFI
jgi:hypothetical protein